MSPLSHFQNPFQLIWGHRCWKALHVLILCDNHQFASLLCKPLTALGLPHTPLGAPELGALPRALPAGSEQGSNSGPSRSSGGTHWIRPRWWQINGKKNNKDTRFGNHLNDGTAPALECIEFHCPSAHWDFKLFFCFCHRNPVYRDNLERKEVQKLSWRRENMFG